MIKMKRSVDARIGPALVRGAAAWLLAVIAFAGMLQGAQAQAPQRSLQVLHWWTSAGERRALDVVVNQLARQDIQWRDISIPGGAGMGAVKVLKSMVLANRAPEVTQLNGVIFGEWADLGLLLELDNVAVQGNWEKQMFPTVWQLLNNRGHVVAAPLGIHRINTLFYNIAVFNRLGLTPPKTWDDFFRVARVLREAGIVPLAQSAEAWQVATLFENLALAESGPAYYRRLFVDVTPSAYADARMLHILRQLRKLGEAMAQPVRERPWTEVARSMADGEAGMFIMGDWAKGEFNAWGLTADQQFGCTPVPGTGEYHLYSTDTLAMFAGSYVNQPQQETLAQIVTSPAVQSEYNKFKGSIPVWRAPDPHMDRCARDSWRAFSKGQAYQAPSLVHRMATDETTKDAIIAEVQRFFLDRNVTEEQAQKRLAAIARTLSRNRND
ncbi:carbohydrate ABC transporter substrate-binding protein [Herbaspirillum sp. LeCh32-8]|uniref:ABC transporter substrate-binding protein n=1 Tax=Herbaspirillum sp. LeCh32-8 TaxID=2821356 RepID=UPI001AE66C01|nr:ABC transporter substrate-binding protein [Herbaspirillum sp. LeCh32-8]MBP0598103.1 carbohydrate ABC transporter substrate-binding protein [Herbaspirillum sp. LeCh32-8]